MRGSKNAVHPLGNPDIALVQANTDFLANLTGRVGYAFDNVLLYARGGAALAGDKFEVSGTFTGLPYDFRGLDNRFGWVVGGGVDWAFSQHWSTLESTRGGWKWNWQSSVWTATACMFGAGRNPASQE